MVDEREVRLNRQEVTREEHGDWAEVELYEVYQNQTADPQEVIYYFNLPEIGRRDRGLAGEQRRPRRHRLHYPGGHARRRPGHVPRGDRSRNIDPALLEQIGPRQYRLRVYPIE